MTILNLDVLVPPQRGRIIKVGGTGPLRQRMMDMGLVSGAEIKVVRVAPLGDPVEYEVCGYHLSLRGREARNILVDVEWMTLEQATPASRVRLADVSGGRQLRVRLAEMGIATGSELHILKNIPGGPLIVQAGGEPVRIGRGMARKLLVTHQLEAGS